MEVYNLFNFVVLQNNSVNVMVSLLNLKLMNLKFLIYNQFKLYRMKFIAITKLSIVFLFNEEIRILNLNLQNIFLLLTFPNFLEIFLKLSNYT